MKQGIWTKTLLADYLCEKGVDVISTDNEGNSPLHLACKLSENFYENKIIKTLILHGENNMIKQKNKAGKTPLRILLEEHDKLDLEIVESLVKKCPEALEKDEMDNNILHILFSKDCDFPRWIVKEFPHLLKEINKEGQTPLHIAALNGMFKPILVKYIDHSIANLKDNDGRTILNYIACSHECYDNKIIARLIKKVNCISILTNHSGM